MAKRKSEIIWGIRQYGILLPFLCASQRKGAIKEARDWWRSCDESVASWAKMRRHGFTVHKLRVTNG